MYHCRLLVYSTIFRCDTTAKLQGKISSLRMSLDDPTQFKIIYRYAFDFAKVSFSIDDYR